MFETEPIAHDVGGCQRLFEERFYPRLMENTDGDL